MKKEMNEKTNNETRRPQVGDKIRFSHGHLLQTVVFTVVITKVTETHVSFVVPSRVRSLPFPPFNGWTKVKVPIANIKKESIIRKAE